MEVNHHCKSPPWRFQQSCGAATPVRSPPGTAAPSHFSITVKPDPSCTVPALCKSPPVDSLEKGRCLWRATWDVPMGKRGP